MKKLLLLTITIASFAIVSCNKNQQAVKQLDGTWKLVITDGVAVPDSASGTVKFDNCKLKKDEYCNATYTYFDGSQDTYTYKVTDDGTTLVQRIEDSGLVIEIPSTIDELDGTKLVLTTTFIGTTTQEYEKQ